MLDVMSKQNGSQQQQPISRTSTTNSKSSKRSQASQQQGQRGSAAKTTKTTTQPNSSRSSRSSSSRSRSKSQNKKNRKNKNRKSTKSSPLTSVVFQNPNLYRSVSLEKKISLMMQEKSVDNDNVIQSKCCYAKENDEEKVEVNKQQQQQYFDPTMRWFDSQMSIVSMSARLPPPPLSPSKRLANRLTITVPVPTPPPPEAVLINNAEPGRLISLSSLIRELDTYPRPTPLLPPEESASPSQPFALPQVIPIHLITLISYDATTNGNDDNNKIVGIIDGGIKPYTLNARLGCANNYKLATLLSLLPSPVDSTLMIDLVSPIDRLDSVKCTKVNELLNGGGGFFLRLCTTMFGTVMLYDQFTGYGVMIDSNAVITFDTKMIQLCLVYIPCDDNLISFSGGSGSGTGKIEITIERDILEHDRSHEIIIHRGLVQLVLCRSTSWPMITDTILELLMIIPVECDLDSANLLDISIDGTRFWMQKGTKVRL